jgi:hypothetical protein
MKLLAPNGKPSNLNEQQWQLVRTPEFKRWFGDWEKLAYAKLKDAAMDEVTLENLSKNVSKVVDENDEPMVVWHSSPSFFNIFDKEKSVKGIFHFGTIQQAIYRLTYYIENIGFDLTPYIQLNNEQDDEMFEIDIYWKLVNYILLLNFYDKNDVDVYFENIFNSRQKEFLKNIKINIDKNKIKSELDKYNIKPYFLRVKKLGKTNDAGEDWELDSSFFDGYIYINLYEGNKKEYSFVVFNPNQIKLADGSNTTFDGNNPDIRFERGGDVRFHYLKNVYNSNQFIYHADFGNNGKVTWEVPSIEQRDKNGKFNYLIVQSMDSNWNQSKNYVKEKGEGSKVINDLFQAYPHINSILYDDESEGFWTAIGGDIDELKKEDFYEYYNKIFKKGGQIYSEISKEMNEINDLSKKDLTPMQLQYLNKKLLFFTSEKMNTLKETNENLWQELKRKQRNIKDILDKKETKKGVAGSLKEKYAYHFTTIFNLTNIIESKSIGNWQEFGHIISLTTNPIFGEVEVSGVKSWNQGMDIKKAQLFSDLSVKIVFDLQKIKADGIKITKGSGKTGTHFGEYELIIPKFNEKDKWWKYVSWIEIDKNKKEIKEMLEYEWVKESNIKDVMQLPIDIWIKGKQAESTLGLELKKLGIEVREREKIDVEKYLFGDKKPKYEQGGNTQTFIYNIGGL